MTATKHAADTSRAAPAPAPDTAPAAAAPTESVPADARHLRLVRVPTPQPPLADEPVRLVLRGTEMPRAPHRPGPRPHPDRPRHPDADFGPSWSSRTELPDPRTAGRHLLTLVVETFGGRRPLTQLRPLTTPGLFAVLARGRHPHWCSASTSPAVLGRVHVCEPVDGVAEVSAVVRQNGRAHALAARLEGMDGRWRCTALQVG